MGIPIVTPATNWSQNWAPRQSRTPSNAPNGSPGVSVTAIVANSPPDTAKGRRRRLALLGRVSPLAHRDINFLGRCAFPIPEAVARRQRRPLRDPNSE